ncbi:GNAT family N-acetyltransferase [Agromyces sp. SYSU K20354]|uniref:GNAT family N-acetyltransferase n=1 Tax=Agromyces cavernae TaxID=2898659 RepID=UPI001E57DF30|nr:GNAT family N-acetyltransferase [Agromyces cavernae]MCD2442182.1 GNAT family N-acetyltransferase [Agromyces cavernae]
MNTAHPTAGGGRPSRLPVLSDDRVRLRAFRAEDLALIVEASADSLIPLITTVPSSSDRWAARAYLTRQARRLSTGAGYSFAIADAGDRAVGQIGLWPRRDDPGRAGIGYWLAASARGQGYAGAAVRLVVDWAWTIASIDRLELFIEPSNAASIAVAEATGFAREGLLRSWMRIGDTRRDMLVYSLIRGQSESGPEIAPPLSARATSPKS